MAETASVPPMLNKAMKFVLRSPLHGIISKNLLLISFTGCRSGKKYTTPVSYFMKNNEVIVFTHANWWKNLRGGAPVQLRFRGKDRKGMAEPVNEDKSAIAIELAQLLKQSPFDSKFYDVTFDKQGNPNQAEVDRAVQTVTMIRILLG